MHRGGAEITAESQGPWDLRNGNEISIQGCTDTELHLLHQLCEFSTCRTSKETAGTPEARRGLTLAAAGLVSARAQELGRARV